jgi:hypothetical protein
MFKKPSLKKPKLGLNWKLKMPSFSRKPGNLASAPKVNVTFVAQAQDTRRTPKRKAVLSGQAVFLSLKDTSLDGFVRLPPRSTIAPLKAMMTKNPAKVYVSIDKKLIEGAPKNYRFALAVDSYLKYGYSAKDNLVILGGTSGQFQTNVEIMVFRAGALVEIDEQHLPDTNSSHYADTVNHLIDQLRQNYPNHRIVVAPPLDLGMEVRGVEKLDERIFKGAHYVSLRAQGSFSAASWLIPSGIVTASVIGCVAILSQHYTQYEKAVADYDAISQDPVMKANGGMGGQLIEKIEKRRDFMKESVKAALVSDRTRAIISGIALVPNARIVTVGVAGPMLAGDAPEMESDGRPKPHVTIELSVPLTADNANDQARVVMDIIAAHAGLDLHMARDNGFKDNDKRRHFRMEGSWSS